MSTIDAQLEYWEESAKGWYRQIREARHEGNKNLEEWLWIHAKKAEEAIEDLEKLKRLRK